MLIDSHCHLDRLKLKHHNEQLSHAIDAATERGVRGMLCIGISLDNREAVVGIAENYQNVVASVGVHPLDVDSGLATVNNLVEWGGHQKVVALGETGLDYYYSTDTKQIQQQSFITHIEASNQSALPVVVHTRSAKEDTLSIIKQHCTLEKPGVLHCFTEDWDMASRAIDLNFYISISGIVTFKNAEELRDVVRKVPIEKLLVETDSPYLAPVPYRGKSNEPAYVREVAEYVADLKQVSYSTLIEKTAENFFTLFPKAKPFIS